MNILINNATKITASINKGKYTHAEIKQVVIDAGFDWAESEVFIAHWPEQGRSLQKSKGRTQLTAGG